MADKVLMDFEEHEVETAVDESESAQALRLTCLNIAVSVYDAHKPERPDFWKTVQRVELYIRTGVLPKIAAGQR